MRARSQLDLMMQTTEVKRVDYFPNGRGRRWLGIYREGDHTWSIGLIEKTNNTATEIHPYKVYAYDPPMKGDMSDPHWTGDYAGDNLKRVRHYADFSRHDKVNDALDDFIYSPAEGLAKSVPLRTSALTMVRDVVIHMSGVNPPVS